MYDAAFKFLIEDNACAKLLLSEIMGKEILECTLLNNEIVYLKNQHQKTGVLKLDFKAKIKTQEGEHLMVIIEVQKANYTSNYMRFRQYLGHQYIDKNNVYEHEGAKLPLPIFSIYFLGYYVGIDNSVPIIKVKPLISDYTTQKEVLNTCTFIQSLSHEMIIIQTRALRNTHRSKLEAFLSNFSPEQQIFLDIDPEQFEQKYVSLFKRLRAATMKKEIVEAMQKDDLLQEEWDSLVENLEKERLQKEAAIQKQEQERKDKEIAQRLLIETFLQLGLNTTQIASKLNISESEITRILNQS